MNDIENILVKKAKNKDHKAFEKIVIMYQDKVYNTAMKMCKNEHDAYDVSQEVFLRLYKSLDKFKGDSSLSTYIYRITTNICIDFYRQNKQDANTISLYGENDDEEYELPIADTAPSPEQYAQNGEMIEALKQGISMLGDDHKKMIVLREINGLSYKEIARVTGINEATVKTKILRAREKLRVYLEKSGNFSEYIKSNN